MEVPCFKIICPLLSVGRGGLRKEKEKEEKGKGED